MRGKTWAMAVCVGTCLSVSAAMAGPVPGLGRVTASPPGSQDGPEFVSLSNNLAGDGRLVVNPDTFGGVTVWGWPDNFDFYDPAGAPPLGSPSFASSLFLYAGTVAAGDRIVLGAAGRNLATTYFGSYVATITGALVASDADGDTVNDTADSAFTVTGGTNVVMNLGVALKQRVFKPAAGSSVARFRQRWTITNNAAAAASFRVQRHLDADMLYIDATAEDVSGSIDAPGCNPINPYQRDETAGVPTPGTTAIIGLVTTTPGGSYYAGKAGFDPDGAAGPDPAFAFGTDFQIWNNYGLPPSWKNHTAGIGNSPLAGELPGTQPVGSLTPFDSFIGYEWDVNLAPGASITIETTQVYGAKTSFCYPDANCSGTLTVADFGAFQGQYVLGNLYADCNNSGGLSVADFGCFQGAYVLGCP